MSNIVKPKLSAESHSNYSGVTANLSIGTCEWSISLKPPATESKVDEYSRGKKDLENLKLILAAADTVIDEHCHDAFLVEEHNKWKEAQRIEAENKVKANAEREAKELADLTTEVKVAFAGTGFKFSITSYNIKVTDGISEVNIHRDGYNESKRWYLNARERRYSGGHGYYIGEKKASTKIAKLVDFTKRILKEKTDAVNYKKNVIKTTEETDAEMLAMGYEPGCQGEYIGYNQETKQYDYKKVSNSGTTYKKDNVTIYVKRNDAGVLEVASYKVDNVNVTVEQFKV